jgi:uncharacterized protein involved in type VI secretion and phage assembly
VSPETSRARSTDQRYYGVVEAIVVDVYDPEDEGRVKVRFPWFDEAMISEWCRVAQPYAGNGYGFVWVPELEDEVLVAFVHGDMRMPIVVGGLYNGVDKPPTAKQPGRDQKMIRTKGGHELVMDDTSGSERTRLTTAGGHTLDLDDAGKKVTVASTAGHSVLIDENAQSIAIETAGGQSVSLDGASGKITISATSVTLDATAISLGSAAAQSVVLGTTFLALFNAHVHTTGIPGGPTSPPVPPLTPAILSQTTKTL